MAAFRGRVRRYVADHPGLTLDELAERHKDTRARIRAALKEPLYDSTDELPPVPHKARRVREKDGKSYQVHAWSYPSTPRTYVEFVLACLDGVNGDIYNLRRVIDRIDLNFGDGTVDPHLRRLIESLAEVAGLYDRDEYEWDEYEWDEERGEWA